MTELPHFGPLPTYPFYDWALLTGAVVEVRRHGTLLGSGRVDAATPDGTIVWLAREGLTNRTLIDKASGFEIWIAPPQLRILHARAQARNGQIPLP